MPSIKYVGYVLFSSFNVLVSVFCPMIRLHSRSFLFLRVMFYIIVGTVVHLLFKLYWYSAMPIYVYTVHDFFALH